MKRIITHIWFKRIVIFALIAGAAVFLFHYLITPSKVKIVYNNEKKPKPEEQIKKTSANENPTITLSFFGDLMLDRSVRQHINKKSIDSIFSQDEELYEKADVNIANLEGPVANFSSKSVNTKEEDAGHFSFVFEPSSLPALVQRNFSVFNLGNNHILNFGKEGLQQTKENLHANSIDYFGNPDDNNYFIFEKNGLRAALISYSQFRHGSQQAVLEQIGKMQKEADIVVVYTHWGEEYKPQPNQTQQILAHQFIDAGADAVIGSHPHVVQSMEVYNGKYIFYSLGNFVFDQFFSEETKNGLNVVLRFNKKKWGISYEVTPISISNTFQVTTTTGEKARNQLNKLAESSVATEAEKELLRQGKGGKQK